jgi:hypothetical protein
MAARSRRNRGGTAAGFAVLTVHGFPVPGEAVLVPMTGVLAVTVGANLLRVDPFGPIRARGRS